MNPSAAASSRVESSSPCALSDADIDGLPDCEAGFYNRHDWCLNPFPTVKETVALLSRELGELNRDQAAWQLAEVATNVYLFSCALTNAVDEFLRGAAIRLPKHAPAFPFHRQFKGSAERLLSTPGRSRRERLAQWRARWQPVLDAFIARLIAAEQVDQAALARTGAALAELLTTQLPGGLDAKRIYFPSAFRKHDLTHFDVLSLGSRFVAEFPDRGRPLLVVGIRTAGSYFAPVLHAYLRSEGFPSVEVVTIRPDKGPSVAEQRALTRGARTGCRVVIVDDAPRTGHTIVQAAAIARRAGFENEMLTVLVPVHSATRDWRQYPESQGLGKLSCIALDADDWYKRRVLEPQCVEDRLNDFFAGEFSSVSVVPSAVADAATELINRAEEPRRARLKRVYQLQLTASDEQTETRYVLAKSVGWGWLGYHAHIIGRRLERFVPKVFGLRDGILYSEWIPQGGADVHGEPTKPPIDRLAAYVAARVLTLGMKENPLPSLGLHQHHDSLRLLDRVLSRAYGRVLTANLKRPQIRARLVQLPCRCPTLIDGKMEPAEWVSAADGPLKSDYEHHGMGKNELNLADPAYDLAETILHHGLSVDDEQRLLRTYIRESGDAAVAERLFINKLLAGTWATAAALKYLFRKPPLPERQHEFNRQFIAAWHFLTVQTARFCGDYCRPVQPLRWQGPLVALDIDGVLDRRIFGFPSTTAAGIKALAILQAHEFAVAVNTARSAIEAREYCAAYGLVGGVAEYGAYVWNAVDHSEQVLLSPETLSQLAVLCDALRQIPGVFLDDRHEYSIRAYTFEQRAAGAGRSRVVYLFGSIKDSPYEGRCPAPLPPLMATELIATLGLDRLRAHHTSIDTTIVGAEVDKGTGLSALRTLAEIEHAETIAIGDSEPDLPMFRAASRSFAPDNVRYKSAAKALGCQIVPQPYQRGLLTIAQRLAHDGGRRCPTCASRLNTAAPGHLFMDLLRVADRRESGLLMRALLNPGSYKALIR